MTQQNFMLSCFRGLAAAQSDLHSRDCGFDARQTLDQLFLSCRRTYTRRQRNAHIHAHAVVRHSEKATPRDVVRARKPSKKCFFLCVGRFLNCLKEADRVRTFSIFFEISTPAMRFRTLALVGLTLSRWRLFTNHLWTFQKFRFTARNLHDALQDVMLAIGTASTARVAHEMYLPRRV